MLRYCLQVMLYRYHRTLRFTCCTRPFSTPHSRLSAFLSPPLSHLHFVRTVHIWPVLIPAYAFPFYLHVWAVAITDVFVGTGCISRGIPYDLRFIRLMLLFGPLARYVAAALLIFPLCRFHLRAHRASGVVLLHFHCTNIFLLSLVGLGGDFHATLTPGVCIFHYATAATRWASTCRTRATCIYSYISWSLSSRSPT